MFYKSVHSFLLRWTGSAPENSREECVVCCNGIQWITVLLNSGPQGQSLQFSCFCSHCETCPHSNRALKSSEKVPFPRLFTSKLLTIVVVMASVAVVRKYRSTCFPSVVYKSICAKYAKQLGH